MLVTTISRRGVAARQFSSMMRVGLSWALLVALATACDTGDPPDERHGEGRLAATAAAAGDTYIELLALNTNHGSSTTLKVQGARLRRALVHFSTSEIVAAMGGWPLTTATLELTIASPPSGAWQGAHLLAVHRMTTPWTEGGATGLCPIDTTPTNLLPDCGATQWAPWTTGGLPPLLARPWMSSPSATAPLTAGQTGPVQLDVTNDVAAFLAGAAPNNGWALRMTEDLFLGEVSFGSRESSSAPRLVLVVGGVPTGSGGSGGAGGAGGDSPTDAAMAVASSVIATSSSGSTAESSTATTGSYIDCGEVGDIDDGNECTADTCDSVNGVQHAPRTGEPCTDVDQDACTGTAICTASAECVHEPPPPIDDGSHHTVDFCDPATGTHHVAAPSIDPTVATTIMDSLGFLVAGPHPPQRGFQSGSVTSERAAGIKGRVLGDDGEPLANATVRIPSKPEFGFTSTDAAGEFVMLVEGGSSLRLQIRHPGHLTADRNVRPPWQGWAAIEPVQLVLQSPRSTVVDLGTIDGVATVEGEPSIDAAGERTAVLLFPEGVQASAVLPDSTLVSLDTISVRLTEYTVGSSGPRRMPATLPRLAAYTYAIEATIDEAEELGATSVVFDQPVTLLVENFHEFPVGAAIPLGSYDRAAGVWKGEPDGLVVRVLGATSGLADLELDGNPATDDTGFYAQLGITEEERGRIAELYDIGVELQRFGVRHFSPLDGNDIPFTPPDCHIPGDCGGVVPIGGEGDEGGEDENCNESNSIIDCESQGLREQIPIVGTGLSLVYSSRSAKRRGNFSITLPLTEPIVPEGLQRARLELEVAGRTFEDGVDCMPLVECPPDLHSTFEWDGNDRFGNPVYGRVLGTVTWEYAYRLRWAAAAAELAALGFGEGVTSWNGGGRLGDFVIDYTGEDDIFEVRFARSFNVKMGGFLPEANNVGGWTLDAVHIYDPGARTLELGDGTRRRVDATEPIALKVDEAGPTGPTGIGLALLPDGRLLSCFTVGSSTFLRASDMRTAGHEDIAPPPPECGDLEVSSDGTIYAGWNRIYRRSPDGAWTHVACGGTGSDSIDQQLATQAACNSAATTTLDRFTVDDDGTMFVAADYRIFKVDPGGLITRLVGDGIQAQVTSSTTNTFGEGGPGRSARISRVGGMDVDANGALIFQDQYLVRRLAPSGLLETLAGVLHQSTTNNSTVVQRFGTSFDGAALLAARDGRIYFGDEAFGWTGGHTQAIRVVRDDSAVVVAGADCATCGTFGGAARATLLSPPTAESRHLTMVGELDDGTMVVRRNVLPYNVIALVPRLPGLGTQLTVASERGDALYVFDPSGRHTSTLDGQTGITVLTATYDSSGRLSEVLDRNGLKTIVRRNASGAPTAIEGPFGHTTRLSTNPNGFLESVENPAGEMHWMAYDAGGHGLLEEFRRPGNELASVLAYDEDSLLVSDTNAAGDETTLIRVEDEDGYTVELETPLGRVRSYEVEETTAGEKLRAFTDAAGLTTSDYLRPDDGRTATFPDGTIHRQEVGPDPRWGMHAPVVRFERLSIAGGPTMNIYRSRSMTPSNAGPFTFNELTDTFWINPSLSSGLPSSSAKKYVRKYVRSTRTETWTTPAGRVTTTVFDALGRPTSRTGPGVLPFSFAYVPTTGQLATITQGGRQRAFTYGADGLLDTAQDALDRTFLFDWDDAARLASTTRPDLEPTLLSYDDNGNIDEVTVPGGASHGFSHTPLDFTEAYTPPPVSGAGATQYTYDADKALTVEDLPGPAALTHSYALASGRRQSVTGAANGSSLEKISWSHDTVGRVATIGGARFTGGSPDQLVTFVHRGPLVASETSSGATPGVLARTFDNALRLSTETVNGASSVTYGYDDDSLVTTAGELTIGRHAASGRVETVSSTFSGHTIVETRTYDAFGAVSGITYRRDGALIVEWLLARDDLGRVDTIQEDLGSGAITRQYFYDDVGRLEEVELGGVVVEHYEYDPNGNRILAERDGATVTYEHDAQDRLLGAGAESFTYSARGDLETITGGDRAIDLAHDSFGHLLGATVDGVDHAYVTDGLGRRVQASTDGVVDAGWLWRSSLAPAAQLDASGTVVARYVYATQLNAPDLVIAGTAPTSPRWRLVRDHLGSVRLVVDVATGAVVRRLDFDAFGRVTGSAGDLDAVPFGFAGGLWDPDTLLVRFGSRDYDPEVGRWVSKDPSRFAGGLNFYAYGHNDPVNHIDVSGDVPVPVIIVAVGAFASVFFAGSEQEAHNAAIGNIVGLGAGALLSKVAGALGTAICRGAAGGAGSTPLYRAVTQAELDDIVARGAFRNPAGIESKYFSTSAEGAASYARQAARAFGDGPFTIVEASIPSNLITPGMRVTVDRGIQTVVVGTETLPALGRPVVWPYSPLPW